jgi:NAD/NADP transhydrogenase beta subunit
MESALQTPGFFTARLLIDVSYLLTAFLFIMGLKRMSSPVTARSGILWAGAGMLVATLVSFLYPGMSNYELIIAAIVVGSIVAWWSGKKVAMTDMPQMIALYNGGAVSRGVRARRGCRVRAQPGRDVTRRHRRHHRRHLVQR